MNMTTDAPQTTELAILEFLLDHSDTEEDTSEAVVSQIRQEEIARHLGLPLVHVITAIDQLQRRGQLRAERQPVGQPFRYHLSPSTNAAW